MITTCTGCQTRYRLDDAKVPRRMIQVRCPGCQSIFMLDGTSAAHVDQSGDMLGLETSTNQFQFEPPQPDSGADLPGGEMKVRSGSLDNTIPETMPPAAAPPLVAPASAEIMPTAGESSFSEAPALSKTAVAVDDAVVPKRRRTRDKTAMLARALVSDILVYNQDARDKALAEGNLLDVLGPEIKKSWELYKEKVTAEVANNTSHFRDALNDILADGQKIF